MLMQSTLEPSWGKVNRCWLPGRGPEMYCHIFRTATNLARLRKLRQYSHSADETGSSSGSAEQIYLPPRHRKHSNRSKASVHMRPLTSCNDVHSDIEEIRHGAKQKSLKAKLSLKLKSEVSHGMEK